MRIEIQFHQITTDFQWLLVRISKCAMFMQCSVVSVCVCVVFYWYYERKCTALKHIHDMAKVMWTIFESKIFIFLVSTMCYIQLHTQWQTKKKPAKKTSIIGNDASKIELLFIIFFFVFANVSIWYWHHLAKCRTQIVSVAHLHFWWTRENISI